MLCESFAFGRRVTVCGLAASAVRVIGSHLCEAAVVDEFLFTRGVLEWGRGRGASRDVQAAA